MATFARSSSPSPFSNPIAEYLVDFTLDFFSKESNRQNNQIENFFIPILLNFSERFDDGKKLDLTLSKGSITHEQREFYGRIFREARTFTINTSNITDKDIFSFLVSFQKIVKLCITLNGDDIFNFPADTLKLQIINITAIERFIWLDPVGQILNNNSNVITEFALDEGTLTSQAIHKLIKNPVHILKLKNITIYTRDDKEALITFLIDNPLLKRLSAVCTKRYIGLNNFHNFMQDFFEATLYDTTNIEVLEFTIQQRHSVETFNLHRYPNLYKITVYYSVEYEIENIQKIITELNKFTETKELQVTFIEYNTNNIDILKRIDIEVFKTNSEHFWNVIKRTLLPIAIIKTFPY